MKGRLGRLANRLLVSITIGLVTVAVVTGWLVFSPRLRLLVGLETSSTGYEVGQQIDVPSKVYAGYRTTVIVFSRSTCPGCRRAKPLLARIGTRLQHSSTARMAIVTAVEHTEDEIQYAADLGIARNAMFRVNPYDVRAAMTPTVVVVNQNGRVVFVRQGPLEDRDEDTIARLLPSG